MYDQDGLTVKVGINPIESPLLYAAINNLPPGKRRSALIKRLAEDSLRGSPSPFTGQTQPPAAPTTVPINLGQESAAGIDDRQYGVVIVDTHNLDTALGHMGRYLVDD